MPRINQIVGCLIQVAAVASMPSCVALVSVMDIYPTIFYVGEDASKEYKALIGKSESVYEMSRFPNLADHTGPETSLKSKLTGGADYCRFSVSFGGERYVNCYAVTKNKIEHRSFNDYSCEISRSSSNCDVSISISSDHRDVGGYQQAADISQELSAGIVRVIFTFVSMVIAFTFPLWLFLGGWIAKNKRKDSQAPEG